MKEDIIEKKNEIRELLTKLLFEDESLTEKEEDEIVQRIEYLSPDPEVTNYIFEKKYEDLSIDEIIENIFDYQPIVLDNQSE